MIAYIMRRLLYAIPILIGVNIITFGLFFLVNTPDDMARMQLGVKRVTPEAIANWKQERGYDKPLLFNASAAGSGKLTQTIFFEKSLRMFVFDFGRADDGRDIAREIGLRMGPSLAVAVPSFLVGLFVYITFALVFAFFRATAIDFWGVVMCVAAMSISAPVRGSRPLEALRWVMAKVPNPTRRTSSPSFSAPSMALSTASTASAALAFGVSVRAATAAIKSILFTV